MPDREPATEHADTHHRHGEGDPSKWDEQEAVTGRANDTPLRGVDTPAVPNTTLADRAKARGSKRVAEAENKAVAADEPATKTTKARKRR